MVDTLLAKGIVARDSVLGTSREDRTLLTSIDIDQLFIPLLGEIILDKAWYVVDIGICEIQSMFEQA